MASPTEKIGPERRKEKKKELEADEEAPAAKKSKKVLHLTQEFLSERKWRPRFIEGAEEDFWSSDDDEESKAAKGINISHAMDFYKKYALGKGENGPTSADWDEPFHSLSTGFGNVSRSTFGHSHDFEETWEREVVRRVGILVGLYCEDNFFHGQLDFVEYLTTDKTSIPPPWTSIPELFAKGWNIPEWKCALRRLIRRLIASAHQDSVDWKFSRVKQGAGREFFVFDYLEDRAPDSDEEDYEESNFDKDWEELFYPYKDSTCSTLEDVQDLERHSIINKRVEATLREEIISMRARCGF